MAIAPIPGPRIDEIWIETSIGMSVQPFNRSRELLNLLPENVLSRNVRQVIEL
jgi:hypothetical protein